MALEDFIGKYKIKNIEGILENVETRGNTITIRLEQGKPVITSSGSPGIYQNVRYVSQEDLIAGDLQTQPVYTFKIQALNPNKRVHCRVPPKSPNDLGSWTAEDDDGTVGGGNG